MAVVFELHICVQYRNRPDLIGQLVQLGLQRRQLVFEPNFVALQLSEECGTAYQQMLQFGHDERFFGVHLCNLQQKFALLGAVYLQSHECVEYGLDEANRSEVLGFLCKFDPHCVLLPANYGLEDSSGLVDFGHALVVWLDGLNQPDHVVAVVEQGESGVLDSAGGLVLDGVVGDFLELLWDGQAGRLEAQVHSHKLGVALADCLLVLRELIV